MDKKGANIDIVFRNGFKDFEVLPPSDVWDSVQPFITRKQKSGLLLRAAAAVAVLVTVSVLAFRVSLNISNVPEEFISNLQEEAALSEELIARIPDNKIASNQLLLQDKHDNHSMSLAVPSDDVIQDKNETLALAVTPESKKVVLSNTEIKKSKILSIKDKVENSLLRIDDFELAYIPENIDSKPANRWSIAALASPTYYSRFNPTGDQLVQQLQRSEQAALSYTGGVAFSYKINSRFSIQSGLFYSSVGQEVEGINSYAGFEKYVYSKGSHNFEVLTANGVVYTNNADVFLAANGPVERVLTNYTIDVFDPNKAQLEPIGNNLLQNFSYLELPVVLRYKLVDRTIDFNLIGGLSYNMLVGNSVFTLTDAGKYQVGTTDGLNSATLSSSIGMGMEYNLSGNLSINVEPTFRYYINPFNQLTVSGIHPYSFGIFSGLSYKF